MWPGSLSCGISLSYSISPSLYISIPVYLVPAARASGPSPVLASPRISPHAASGYLPAYIRLCPCVALCPRNISCI